MTGNSLSPNPSPWDAPKPQDSLQGPSPLTANVLTKGEPVTLAVDQPIYGLDEITSGPETPGFVNSVVGEIELHGATNGGNKYEGNTLAVVKSTNKYGVTSILLMGLEVDEHGRKQKVPGGRSIDLPRGTELTIGRGTGQDNPKHLDGTELFGKDFSAGISREHLKIRWDGWDGSGKGVRIEDLSSNGTSVVGKIEAAEKGSEVVKPEVGRQLGAVALISEVPKSSADVARLQEEALRGPLAEIDAQIDQVQADMKSLTEGLTERDRLALWKYSAGLLNKREAQQKGDGQASYDHERMAGEGLREMSPQAQELKSRYHQLMGQNSALLNRRSQIRGR